MPLYFFHLRNDTDVVLDGEGIQLPDISTAREFALRQARNIISHEVLAGQLDLAQRIDVVDKAGAVVCSLRFKDAVEIRGLE